MLRAYLLTFVTYSFLILGAIFLRGAFLAASVPLVAYLLYAYFRRTVKSDLQATRTLEYDRVRPKAPVVITIEVFNAGETLDEVTFYDELPSSLHVIDGEAIQTFHLPAGERVHWQYTVQAERGYYTFPTLMARVGDAFGLSPTTHALPTEGQLFILPLPKKLKDITIRPRRTKVYAGNIPASTGGAGIDFFDVREYQMGDSQQWINWRASARHPSTLFSNVYEQERVADIGIIIDGRAVVNRIGRDEGLFEHTIAAASTLADAFLSRGDRVGLLLYGNMIDWTLPGYGKMQREKILRVLAQATIGDSQVFAYLDYLPTPLFPPKSQIVLISPLNNTDSASLLSNPLSRNDTASLLKLRALGYELMVVSPNPVLYETNLLGDGEDFELATRILAIERELALRRVRQMGIRLLDWDTSIPFDQVAAQVLYGPVSTAPTLRGVAR